jgi:hypothetical protein
MRLFIMILKNHDKYPFYGFYKPMTEFCQLANEYLMKEPTLRRSQRKNYLRRLDDKLIEISNTYEMRNFVGGNRRKIGGTFGRSWSIVRLNQLCHTILQWNGVNTPQYCGYTPDSNNNVSDNEMRRDIAIKFFDVKLSPAQQQLFPVLFHESTVLNSLPQQSSPRPLQSVVDPILIQSPRKVQRETLSKTPIEVQRETLSKTPIEAQRETLSKTPIEAQREIQRKEPMETPKADLTPAPTPRLCVSQPSTPRTPRLPNFSDWLLFKLLSQDFLQFLKQQSEQSSSKQLKQMFGVLRMFFTQYGVELLYHHNRNTIYSFFQDLGEYPVVKIALELYHRKPLDDWMGMDIRIVSESNEEDQKRFYEYLKMMIHLQVWLDADADKPKFSAECDRKLWVFCRKTDSFKVYDLVEPAKLIELLRSA